MTFYEKFELICKQKNLSPTSAVLKSGLSKSNITSWKNGVVPNLGTIRLLSTTLDVPISFLTPDTQSSSISPDETSLLNNYRKLSSIGKEYAIKQVQRLVDIETAKEFNPHTITIQHCKLKVSAGTGYALAEYNPNDWEEISIIDTPQSRKADFVLTITGDSMLPKFEDGDRVLVREQPSVNIGDICIYILAGDGYIKKFGGDKLISLNKDYDDILLKDFDLDDIICRGLVIGKV